jgi:hypothetical protein
MCLFSAPHVKTRFGVCGGILRNIQLSLILYYHTKFAIPLKENDKSGYISEMKAVLHMLKILKTEDINLNKVVMYVNCMEANRYVRQQKIIQNLIVIGISYSMCV